MPECAAPGWSRDLAGRDPDRTTGSGFGVGEATTMRGMTKRLLAAMLWFYAGWYIGAMIAAYFGVSPFLGPLIGAAAAGLIAGDPRRIIWTSRAEAPTATTSEGLAEAA